MTPATATLSEQIETELASASILDARVRALLATLEPLAATCSAAPSPRQGAPRASGSNPSTPQRMELRA